MTTSPSPAIPRRTLGWLTAASLLVALAILAAAAVILLQARRDTLAQATQATDNLVLALERDIARNIAAYDLSLQGAIDAYGQPGIDAVPPEIRHSAIFDRAATAEYLGSLLILGPAGDIVADSTAIVPHALNLADRDYVRIHQQRNDAGLYVSHPFRSRLRNGDASVAISRRLPDRDGRYAGVAVGTLRLAYFQELFARLGLGPAGAVLLVRTDGEMLVRQPASPDDMGRSIAGSQLLQAFATAPAGRFQAHSMIDGVERTSTYRQVGSYPLILVVSTSVDDIYAPWLHRAKEIGGLMALLCAATVTLTLLFRREVLRRLKAEAALQQSANILAVFAATDGLTGLANRRAFGTEFDEEWRRAARTQTPLALLMIDADWFKPFNDRYGHQAGDEALRTIARAIERCIRRPGDVAARYGGEEFAALLPETDEQGAHATAERIARALAEAQVPHAGSPLGHLTISIGIAVARPRAPTGYEALIAASDAALYDAKRAGRARIVIAPQTTLHEAPAAG